MTTNMGSGAKFNQTTGGHTHANTPMVFYGPVPPDDGMQRGDIWIKTASTARKAKDAK